MKCSVSCPRVFVCVSCCSLSSEWRLVCSLSPRCGWMWMWLVYGVVGNGAVSVWWEAAAVVFVAWQDVIIRRGVVFVRVWLAVVTGCGVCGSVVESKGKL
ncbi:hypothetical protein E2C01_064148 [Portunus trituberculatus]|uniref:Transmembrane protein n=1 Tax=Portunus trituberculatus TaxID=210409 RepID=A0A5B7HK20_PORTR|nr:hypothetical protein [Portunus trituberculatus]